MTIDVWKDIYEAKTKGRKGIAVLVDPDAFHIRETGILMQEALDAGVDYFFVGGSLMTTTHLSTCIQFLKQQSKIPVVLFPGGVSQIDSQADAFLLLSLISGRNPDLLIGKHVEAAPLLRAAGLQIIPTGYMIIDGGKPTTASYISNSAPIPADKPEIAAMTALAGEMLGFKTIYLDAGSGASRPVSSEMIQAVRRTVQTPIIVGGGIRTPQGAASAARAGADITVIGNVLESGSGKLHSFVEAVHSSSSQSSLSPS